MSGLAPKLPLVIDEIHGAYKLIDNYVDLVRQNFKMLLLTVPGERIMNVDYGVGLKQYLFENMIEQLQTQSNVRARIVSQASRYIPYITLGDILFSSIENAPNGIHVYIEFRIDPLGVEDSLDLVVDVESNI